MNSSGFHRIPWRFVFLLGLTLALGLQTGCERKDAQGAGMATPQVTVTPLVPATAPASLEQVGQTQAAESVEIRARVQGFLVDKAFDEGKPVKKGQVLFRIDPRPFEADKKIAEARLAQAQARLDSAQRDLKRVQQLVAQNAGSRKELDDLQTAELQAAADIRLYSAQVDKANLDLSYTTILCPLDGVIGESFKSVGALVDAGANSLLAKVTSVDPMDVVITISEREGLAFKHDIDAGRLKLPDGQKVRVSLKLVDGTPYAHTGQINFISPEIDPQTGTARLRAQMPNPDRLLAPGQFVRASLDGYQRVNALIVPQRSVMQSPRGAFVYVVGKESKIEAREVTLGSWLGQGWVVLGGLAAGDEVVVDGAQKVRPGMPVKAVQAAPSAPAEAPAASASPVSPTR